VVGASGLMETDIPQPHLQLRSEFDQKTGSIDIFKNSKIQVCNKVPVSLLMSALLIV
jgi:hypothetical protein